MRFLRNKWNDLQKLLQNNDFIFLLIMLNAVVILIQEFDVNNQTLNVIEFACTICFVLEICFKIKTRSFKVYISTGWNKLDFVLVLAATPSLFSLFVIDLEFLLVLRIFRIFKFFMLLRYFPRIDLVLPGLKNAIRSSYLVFFGFLTMLFIFSMLSCAIFKKSVPEYFADPIDSMFSIFHVFVGGWKDIPDLVATRSGPGLSLFAKFYFAGLMFIGGVLGLSIINSIFVDAMVDDNNDELKEEIKGLQTQVSELKEMINTLIKEK